MSRDLKAKHRRRRKREFMNLIVMFFVLGSLLGCYQLLLIQENQQNRTSTTDNLKSKFKKGTQVMLRETGSSDFENYGTLIGTIETIKETEKGFIYKVLFSKNLPSINVEENNLKQVSSKYNLGQIIELNPSTGINGEGEITSITVKSSDSMGEISYEANFKNVGPVTNITDDDLATIYKVPLESSNSPTDNLKILQKSMEEAKNNNYTILDFPEGSFNIGTATPDKDYILLTSNIELRGNGAKLIIDGTMYWFGLATGTQAIDGVSNFSMHDLNIEAKDLVNGDHFMLMANHGNNWSVYNNSFTLVHKSGSHIFDLGGVQNASFNNNKFIGYAPDLANETKIPEGADQHAYYSEVIQFDNSDNAAVWDAGLIKRIDPDYDTHNAIKYLSSNIVVDNNEFLPYKDSTGRIIAYSGTIGQHSSDVGPVTITNNRFKSSFVTRFSESETVWFFNPIHLPENTISYISGNTIDN